LIEDSKFSYRIGIKFYLQQVYILS